MKKRQNKRAGADSDISREISHWMKFCPFSFAVSWHFCLNRLPLDKFLQTANQVADAPETNCIIRTVHTAIASMHCSKLTVFNLKVSLSVLRGQE